MKRNAFAKPYVNLSQALILFGLVLLCSGYSVTTWAYSGGTIQGFADNIKKTFSLLREVMTIAAYVAGVGFSMIGLFKFKAHKDNPAQIPLSTPIAMIAVSAGLLFLPTVFDTAGDAVFGSAARPGLRIQQEQVLY